MPFDFPDAPAVGDIYVSGSATYNWDGMTWNLGTTATMDDYVLKAGDTMTGSLNLTGAASEVTTEHRLVVNGSGDKVCIRLPSCEIRKVGEGNMEFWTDNGGYSTTWAMKLEVENPPMTRMRRLNFGQVAATEINDLKNHITLYDGGTTSPFGFNIRSGTLGYVVGNAGNRHCFSVGGAEMVDIKSGGLFVQAKFRMQVQSWGAQFHMPADTDEFVFNLGGTGGGDVYKIDNVGSTGNSVNVTAPEVVDAVRADPALKACMHARKRDAGEAVDLGALLIHALKEIKYLKEELASLKGPSPASPSPASPRPSPAPSPARAGPRRRI